MSEPVIVIDEASIDAAPVKPPLGGSEGPCPCGRNPGRFANATFVVKPDGRPVLLVAGRALLAGKTEIVDQDETRAARVVVEIPLTMVDVISWAELVERREGRS